MVQVEDDNRRTRVSANLPDLVWDDWYETRMNAHLSPTQMGIASFVALKLLNEPQLKSLIPIVINLDEKSTLQCDQASWKALMAWYVEQKSRIGTPSDSLDKSANKHATRKRAKK